MLKHKRSGFTLPEALVAGGMFLCIAAAFFFTWSGSRKEEELAALHLSMLESAALAMQQLRTDMREMVVVATSPTVEGTSLRVSQGALMLRGESLGDQPTDPCMLIEYTTVPAPSKSGAARFHLQRTRRVSDGSPLPGAAGPREVKVFRTFTLAEVGFNYLPQQGSDRAVGDDHVLHISFKVVSDSGRAGSDDVNGEKSMLLTQVLRFLKAPSPRDFAQPINIPGLEVAANDIVSEALAPLPPLPAIEE